MIEDIKKEILYAIEHSNNQISSYDFETIQNEISEILDKYNNQEDYLIVDKKMFTKRLNNQLCYDDEPDCEDCWLAGLEDRANEGERYKNAWEELYSEKEMPCSIEYMQSLEAKYNLGSDKDA